MNVTREQLFEVLIFPKLSKEVEFKIVDRYISETAHQLIMIFSHEYFPICTDVTGGGSTHNQYKIFLEQKFEASRKSIRVASTNAT